MRIWKTTSEDVRLHWTWPTHIKTCMCSIARDINHGVRVSNFTCANQLDDIDHGMGTLRTLAVIGGGLLASDVRTWLTMSTKMR